MKNYNSRKNNLFIKKCSLTRKNSYEKEIDNRFIGHKLTFNKFNKKASLYNKKDISNLDLTNKENKIYFNPISQNYRTNIIMKNDLNLFEIHKKNLFENPELNNVTSGFFENNHCNNTNEFKKTVNQSSQSDFYFDEADPDTRIMKEHYSKIDDILKQKMIINKKRPKLKKIRFKFDKEKDNYMNNFGKSNFHEIFMKKYNKNLKPLQHYLKCTNKENFKNNITPKTIKEKTRNHSLILTKKNSKDEKNIYEVYHSLNNNTIIYANKLVINDDKDMNEDNITLAKGINDINSDYKKILEDRYKILIKKLKSNSVNIKNKNAKKIKFVPYNKIKILSRNGFEKMMNRKFSDFQNQVNNAVNLIESNKHKVSDVMEMNAQIYLKNKKEALNDTELL